MLCERMELLSLESWFTVYLLYTSWIELVIMRGLAVVCAYVCGFVDDFVCLVGMCMVWFCFREVTVGWVICCL